MVWQSCAPGIASIAALRPLRAAGLPGRTLTAVRPTVEGVVRAVVLAGHRIAGTLGERRF